jgi:thiamine-phosphate pyrophosphorylase
VRLRGLYAVTPDGVDSEQLIEKVRRALQGGIALLQYRRKSVSTGTCFPEAKRLMLLARSHGVPFIVNDDIALALALEADGVHLGRDDPDVASARKKLPGGIVGASAYNNVDIARKAVRAGADYVAFGSVFASPTKPAAVRASLSLFKNDFGVPLCAIGGITLDNAPQVIEAGADLLAVISDLFDAPDVAARAREYGKLFS